MKNSYYRQRMTQIIQYLFEYIFMGNEALKYFAI